MTASSDVERSDYGARSPALPTFTPSYLKIDDVQYPAPAEIKSAAVLEDWIVKAEDAVTEARNGVTAIAWPFALAGLLGFLAVLADIADAAPNFWSALASNPYKTFAGCFLFVATIFAVTLSSHTSTERRKLIAIRHAYLRRRRDIQR